MKKHTKEKSLLKKTIYFILFLFTYTVIFFMISNLCQFNSVVGTAFTKSAPIVWNGDTALTEGDYYLTKDIDLSQKIVVESGNTVTLALNGYAIKRTNETAMIEVQEGATLTIQKTMTNSISGSSSNANTIIDDTMSTTPFFKVENAENCTLKEITLSANFVATKSNITVENVEFTKELTLKNCIAKFTNLVIIQDKMNIFDGTEISFVSESSRKKVDFKDSSSIFLENSTFKLDNTLAQNIVIPNLAITGQNTVFDVKKCTIDKFTYDNATESTMSCVDSSFRNEIVLNGNDNSFSFSNVTFGGNVTFTGENHIFSFENSKNYNNKVCIDSIKIKEFACDNLLNNVEFTNLKEIYKFIYQENSLYPQVINLKIEYFIATMSTIIIEGQKINAVEHSNLQIENFIFKDNIKATLNENTILQNSKLYFLPNSSSQDNVCSVTVNYNIENKVMLGKGIEFNFADNGSMKDVEFMAGATVEDYKSFIESGKLTHILPIVPDTVNTSTKFNSTKVITILLVSVIADMIVVWSILILLLKGNKKNNNAYSKLDRKNSI